jgi:dipeptide/tripeptide permease
VRGAFRIISPCFVGEEQISTLSILWLLPQFALIAAAEAFIYPVGSRCVPGVDI